MTNGRISSDSKTILYVGQEEWHECGVGLILSKRAKKALLGWKPVNDQIITACFAYGQVYAPMHSTDDMAKDEFYKKLQNVFDDIPNHDLKILIGDFNAQLGGNSRGHLPSSVTKGSGWRRSARIMGCAFETRTSNNGKSTRRPDGQNLNEIDFIYVSQKLRSYCAT